MGFHNFVKEAFARALVIDILAQKPEAITKRPMKNVLQRIVELQFRTSFIIGYKFWRDSLELRSFQNDVTASEYILQ